MILGLAIIAVPIAMSMRVVLKLLRLGALDGSIVASSLTIDVWQDWLVRCRKAAPKSAPSRLLSAPGELELSEEVNDIERELSLDTRIPRVAASLATSGGLLAASLVFRTSVADLKPAQFESALAPALTLAILAFFGGIVCAVLHTEAIRLRRRRLLEVDSLAERIISLWSDEAKKSIVKPELSP